MTGKRPFLSVEIFPANVMALTKTRLERTWGSMVWSCSDRVAVSGINMERTCFWTGFFDCLSGGGLWWWKGKVEDSCGLFRM